MAPVLRRSFDAADINPIFNHASVLPSVTVPGLDVIDAAPILADHRNVLLMAEGGGILFIADEPGLYEVHTAFLEGHRGAHAIKASLQAYRWMFTHSDCVMLQTRIPLTNKPAMRAAAIVGFELAFTRAKVWPTVNGPVGLRFYRLDYAAWLKCTHALVGSGQAFHSRLDAEYARHGKPPHTHDDEDCHDRNVGACAEMIYGGQPEKAVALYNHWARFSGYSPVALLSRSPIVIDIGEAVLLIEHETFKVIQCRSVGS